MEGKLYQTTALDRKAVVNDNSEDLGSVDRLVIDLETGQIAFAILKFGRFPSHSKYFAVPWELLKFCVSEEKLVLNVPRATLETEPGCDNLHKVFGNLDYSWLGSIYEVFRNQPEWEQKRELERQNELDRLQVKRDTISRRSPAYYWWRDCARRKMLEN